MRLVTFVATVLITISVLLSARPCSAQDPVGVIKALTEFARATRAGHSEQEQQVILRNIETELRKVNVKLDKLQVDLQIVQAQLRHLDDKIDDARIEHLRADLVGKILTGLDQAQIWATNPTAYRQDIESWLVQIQSASRTIETQKAISIYPSMALAMGVEGSLLTLMKYADPQTWRLRAASTYGRYATYFSDLDARLTSIVDSASKDAEQYTRRLAELTQSVPEGPGQLPAGPWVEQAGWDAPCVELRKYEGGLEQGFSRSGVASWTRMTAGEPRDSQVRQQFNAAKALKWERYQGHDSCSGHTNELPNNWPTATAPELNAMHTEYVRDIEIEKTYRPQIAEVKKLIEVVKGGIPK